MFVGRFALMLSHSQSTLHDLCYFALLTKVFRSSVSLNGLNYLFGTYYWNKVMNKVVKIDICGILCKLPRNMVPWRMPDKYFHNNAMPNSDIH